MGKVNDYIEKMLKYLKIEINYNKTEIKDYKLEILYEDNYLIAINKPCKLLSISNDKEKNITIEQNIIGYLKINSI